MSAMLHCPLCSDPTHPTELGRLGCHDCHQVRALIPRTEDRVCASLVQLGESNMAGESRDSSVRRVEVNRAPDRKRELGATPRSAGREAPSAGNQCQLHYALRSDRLNYVV